MSDDGMVEVVKLKAAGDTVTLDVKTAGLLPFGDYPEIEFTGVDLAGRTVAVRVPKVSVERQLTRLKLAQPSEVVGQRLTIKRDKNARQPAKPFWGLYLDSNGNGNGHKSTNAPAAAGESQQAAAPATTARREKRSAIYLAQTKWVLETIVPMYRSAKVEPNANDVHAMVSTLFIAETRSG